jgi:PadR family transcriptional regulator PadR
MYVDERFQPAGLRENGLPPKGTPKNYLMAWLLVLLKDRNLHGYEIMKELKAKFDVVADPGSVYRALRQLEREGDISSWWDPRDQGPARRVYTVTDAGLAALRAWSVALEHYRSNLDQFFQLYTAKQEPAQVTHKLA